MSLDTIEQDTKTLIEAIYQYDSVKKNTKQEAKAKEYILQILEKIKAEVEDAKIQK
ncbi:MAG: hypothetical protein ABIF40_03150 [archaeon]